MKEKPKACSLRTTLIVIWVWPLIALLLVGSRDACGSGLWFLCKSTWVLFAGVMQSIILLTTRKWKKNPQKWYIAPLCLLTFVSILLLPFGLAKWDFYLVYDSNYNTDYDFRMNPYFFYGENIWLSVTLHFLGPLLPMALIEGLTNDTGATFRVGSSSCSGSSFTDSYSGGGNCGSGLWGEVTGLNDDCNVGPVSDGFIGHRGEFDLNDEARRVSEDMQQFHYNHPDADLSDHYYWEDVLDADTDGYLED